MKTLETEFSQNIMVVSLNKGVTNSIDLKLVNELSETLHSVKLDTEVHSLVLSSANEKFFSIGFDIPHLIDLSRHDFKIFYQAFNQLCLDLFTLPIPTVAAITGHAIAGGCILALCCDYRYIATGHKLMGLNEIKLGVPVPFPGDCILQQLIGTRLAREVMESGDFYPPEELLRFGVVDKVIPLDQVLSNAVEKVTSLGSYSPAAYAAIKANRLESMVERIRSQLAEKESHFMELWYTEQTREQLRIAMEKF